MCTLAESDRVSSASFLSSFIASGGHPSGPDRKSTTVAEKPLDPNSTSRSGVLREMVDGLAKRIDSVLAFVLHSSFLRDFPAATRRTINVGARPCVIN